jgi:putative membrane protein
MNTQSPAKEKKYVPLIVAATIAIPLVVTLLAFSPKLSLLGDFDYHVLPMVNALINGSTFFILIAAVIAIKNKRIGLHRALMTSAIALSVAFLVSYVLFHAATEPTPFGGSGASKAIYYFILITHILLSAAIVPLVLISYVRALTEQFDRHKKIAKITFPIWLYVTSTGVIVYLMIAPYYPQ